MPPPGEEKTDKKIDKPSASSPHDQSTADLEAAGRAMARGRMAALGRMEALAGKTEKPPGFAKLPEKTDAEKYLEGLNSEQKLALLLKIISEQKPKTPEQKFLIQKTELFNKFANHLAIRFTKENLTTSAYTRKWITDKYKDQLRMPKVLLSAEEARLVPVALEELKKPKQWLAEHSAEISMKIVAGEVKDIESLIPKDIKDTLDYFTYSKEIKTEKDIYVYESSSIQSMRDYRNYQEAQDKMETLLADEFKKGKKFLGETWINQIRTEVAQGNVFRMYVENQANWRAAGMTEEQIQNYYNGLLKMEEDREINKQIAEHILGKKVAIPEVKKQIYDQYVDMLGLGPWHNMKDETWDTIMKEVAINAPLIVISGGVASVARAGVNKVAVQWLERQGAKYFAGTIGSDIISATARVGVGMLTEGTVFDVTHSALTGEIFRPLPEWGKSIVWSSVTLGLFHGSGKLSERLFTKEIGGLKYATWLGAQTEKITDKAVREAMKVLLLKGHVEAVTMLFVGCLQHAAYKGNIDEFVKNVGDELLHAYITVGALKIAGIPQSKFMEAKERQKIESMTPDERATYQKEQSAKIKLDEVQARLDNKKVNQAEKQRIIKALIEQHPELIPELQRRFGERGVAETSYYEKTVDIHDKRLRFAISNDSNDIELFSNKKSMTSRVATAEIKKILEERGITKLIEGEPIFLEFKVNDPRISDAMRAVLETAGVDKVGIYIFGSLKPEEGGKWKGKPTFSIVPTAFPVCEKNGQMYRVLIMPEWARSGNINHLQERINTVFVPSEIIEAHGQRYLLMPFIKNIEHPTTISREEYQDFVGRLERSGINTVGDMGAIRTGQPITPEDNLVRLNGKLYLCDPGDALSRGLSEGVPDSFTAMKAVLRSRISPDELALATHFKSTFSENLPAEMAAEGRRADDTAGWIDTAGQVHFNNAYFKNKFGVELTRQDGKNVFVVDGQAKSPLELFRTPQGKEVLEEMKRVKNHEVTHRLLEASENLSGGMLGKALMEYVGKNPELQARIHARGEINFRTIQEFLCEVGDGKQSLLREQLAEFLKIIRENGTGLQEFTFDGVRKLDTVRLNFLTPGELARSFADAMGGITVSGTVEQAVRAGKDIVLQATQVELDAVIRGDRQALQIRVNRYKDVLRAMGYEPDAKLWPDGRVVIKYARAAAIVVAAAESAPAREAAKAPAENRVQPRRVVDVLATVDSARNFPSVRQTGRTILDQVADRFIQLRGNPNTMIREFYRGTNKKNDVPIPPDSPIRVGFVERLKAIIEKNGYRYSGEQTDYYFDSFPKGTTSGILRKTYINLPVEKVEIFLEHLLPRMKELGIQCQGKFHRDALNFDKDGNIVSVDQNMIPLYFANDASFRKFVALLPEVEASSGAELYSYTGQDIPLYGLAYGGKVRFALDINHLRDKHTNYDMWVGDVLLVGMDVAKRGGSKQDVMAAMEKKFLEERPDIRSPDEFLLMPDSEMP